MKITIDLMINHAVYTAAPGYVRSAYNSCKLNLSGEMQHTLMRSLNLSKLLEKVQDKTKETHTIDDLQAFSSADSEYIRISAKTTYFTSYIRHKIVSGLSVCPALDSFVYNFIKPTTTTYS